MQQSAGTLPRQWGWRNRFESSTSTTNSNWATRWDWQTLQYLFHEREKCCQYSLRPCQMVHWVCKHMVWKSWHMCSLPWPDWQMYQNVHLNHMSWSLIKIFCRRANEQKEIIKILQLEVNTSFVMCDIAYKNLGRVSLTHQDLTWVSEKRIG